MSGLPEGWTSATLGEVTCDCDQRIPSEEMQFQYVDIGSVDRERKAITAPQTLLGKEAPSRARKHIKHHDVLVSMTRPNLNAVAIVPAELDGQIASTGFDVLRSVEVDPRWIFYTVRSAAFVERMSALVQGALYPAIRSKDVRGYELPLAPLPEQERIADRLDSVLTRVDACRERLDRIPALLKRFRQAILDAATSGHLTENWRTCRDLQIRHFQYVEFGALLKSIRSGSSEVPSDQISPFPILRSSSVRQGSIDYADVKYLTAPQSNNDKDFIENGDILFTRLNGTVEYVGNCSVVENIEPAKCQYPDRLFRARPTEKVLPKYCVVAFSSPNIRQEIEIRAKSTAGHKRISIQDIKEIKIPLPGIDEQREIVRRVESLFAFADRLEARYAAARKQVEQLTPALLAKAFRGELVPQDPNDEPAAELLKRLAANRAEASKARRGRKPATCGA